MRPGYVACVKLTPQARRRLFFALVLAGVAAGAGVYWQRQHEQALADRAMNDIPKEEYERWMQDLGYVD